MKAIPNALTIAGSDSGGGAGIQADLKTMSALGVYSCSVVTALTAQNTRSVMAIHEVPASFIRAQLDAVLDDIQIEATKVGMLASADIVMAVSDGLRRHGNERIVVDPVMVSKSGDRLLRADAVDALRKELIPIAHVLTPNLPEVGDLLNRPEPRSDQEMVEAGRRIKDMGCAFVLVKGGHRDTAETSSDVLIGQGEPVWLEAPKKPTLNTHGTGCTLSSAIAAELALGRPTLEAVSRAKAFVTKAISQADELKVGLGQGPVHHFFNVWSETK